MAEVLPFRGIVYDPDAVAPEAVLAPPYDVIDDAGRAALAAKSEHNCVHVILPEAGNAADKYQDAATKLKNWLERGVLQRDQRPALYRYHQIFEHADLGQTVTRRGTIAAVKLHRFDERVILPHERTLKGPKIDRLELMRATRAHTSQVFGMYGDPAGESDRIFADAEAAAPFLDGVTDDGTRHRVWRVTDREIIGAYQKVLAQATIYIADGHHRYETMLAWRDELAAAAGSLAPRSSAHFGTLFLCNMNDSGLVVLPTHRLLHGLNAFSPEELLKRADELFDVTAIAGGARDPELVRREIAAASTTHTSFAAIFPERDDAMLFRLRANLDLASLGVTGGGALTRLDVTILHTLVIDRLLGIDAEAQAAQTHIKYVKDTGDAFRRTAAGEGQVCFVMQPTPVEQVKAVADAGEVMPQKSTFFYPKIASGIVFRPVDPSEELD